MGTREHSYRLRLRWTGNTGTGTSGYADYKRDHEIGSHGKGPIACSSDPHFRGDRSRWNPEELFVASLSACHQLWYLHLCADAGVRVTAYEDEPEGVMMEELDGSGRFTRVVLRPRVGITAESSRPLALSLHERAHALCFIANSVRCPVHIEPSVQAEPGPRVEPR